MGGQKSKGGETPSRTQRNPQAPIGRARTFQAGAGVGPTALRRRVRLHPTARAPAEAPGARAIGRLPRRPGRSIEATAGERSSRSRACAAAAAAAAVLLARCSAPPSRSGSFLATPPSLLSACLHSRLALRRTPATSTRGQKNTRRVSASASPPSSQPGREPPRPGPQRCQHLRGHPAAQPPNRSVAEQEPQHGRRTGTRHRRAARTPPPRPCSTRPPSRRARHHELRRARRPRRCAKP